MKKLILFIILISLPVILPFVHPGFFPTHDGEWSIVRLADMGRTLRDGQIPARLSGYLNHGYGYPLFNFAYPFPYYLGSLVKLFRFGLVDSIKIIFAATVPLSAVFMFLAAKKLWENNLAGIICAVLYAYLPYRIVDLYARGSIGESVALIFFPLLIWAVTSQKNVLSALVFALLILTHNIMAVLFAPIVVGFVVLRKGSWLFLVLGLGLAAFFWVPALAEKANVTLAITPIADRSLYFVKPEQLILPNWGYGMPTDRIGGFSYQLGLPHALALLLAVISVYWIKKDRKLLVFLVFSSLVMILLMFPFTSIIWQKTPLLREINYPWTLLAPLGFIMSLLAGSLTKFNVGKTIGISLAVGAILLALPHANPAEYFNKGDAYYSTNDATTTSSDELMPLWVKKKPTERPAQKVDIISGFGDISNVSSNSRKLAFNSNSSTPLKLKINTIYYPGWQFKEGNKNLIIDFNNDEGLMMLDLPQGSHLVIGELHETPLRLVSNLISLASLLILAGITGKALLCVLYRVKTRG